MHQHFLKKATFKDGQSISVKGREGERVMYLAHRKGRGIVVS